MIELTEGLDITTGPGGTGVLALTSRRLLFIFDGGRRVTEWAREDIVDARLKRGERFATVFIDARDQFDVFVGFEPRSAAGAIASALKP